MPIILGWLGCWGASVVGGLPCEEQEPSEARDACFAEQALQLARSQPDQADALLQRVESPLVRDYGYLSVTREKDPGNPRWCRQIENPQLRERCDMLIRRPHLHRPLAGEPPASER